MTTITAVEDGTSFICTSQLHSAVSYLFPPAFRTWYLDDGLIFHINPFDSLNNGSFLPQERRKGRRFCSCSDCLRGSICLRSELAAETNQVDKPLFSVPQHSHIKMEFFAPLEGSNTLPQSVQKTRDPIAAIGPELISCEVVRCELWQNKIEKQHDSAKALLTNQSFLPLSVARLQP